MPLFRIETERDNGPKNGVYINRELLDVLELDDDATSFRYCGAPGGHELIRGVIKDVKMGTIFSSQSPMIVYIYEGEGPGPNMEMPSVYIRVKGDQSEAYRQIYQLYLEITGISLGTTTPYIKQQLEQSFSSTRRIYEIVGTFTAIALVISILGLIAMSTYFVQMRSLEIAVRKVLGASSVNVMRRVVFPFMGYILIAFVIAVPVIYYLMNKWLSDFSYRIEVYWWIYALAGVICMAVSFLAVFSQCRRAASANPVKALYQN